MISTSLSEGVEYDKLLSIYVVNRSCILVIS